jgi:serine/threonine protein kinase
MGAAVTTGMNHPGRKLSFNSAEKIHGNYSIEYQIGKGGFSEVFLAINKSNQSKVAIKRINILSALAFNQGLNALANELQVFQRIGSHDNIVNLHCAYRLKNYFYFVMDCLPGGDLRQFLHRNGQLSEQAICYIIASLGSGLHHMHQRGVFHRDIKPENIAFDSVGTPCLTDFGISHIATADSSPFVSCESSGTLPYLAPETLTRSHQHSYQSDFWSLGVVAHELLYGRRPFRPHVPLQFIYFVGNNYQTLWDRSHNLSASSPAIDDISPSPHSPFPDYYVTLDEDGTVPSSLKVYLPPTRAKSSSSPESVSEEMRDLLSGLLDVRIPQRLGSMTRFEDFSEHSAFLQYGYHTSNGLFSSPSPLLEEDRAGVLSDPTQRHSFPALSFEDDFQILNPAIESELDKILSVRDGKCIRFISCAGLCNKAEEDPNTQHISMISPNRDQLLSFPH